MILGERVKKLRKSLGLTQKQFASRVPGKISDTWIGKIERGYQYPSLKILERIGTTFSKPMSYFFKNEDQPTIYEKRTLPMSRIIVMCPKCESDDLIFCTMYENEEEVYFQCQYCDRIFSLKQALFEFATKYQGRRYPYRDEKENSFFEQQKILNRGTYKSNRDKNKT